MFYGDKPSNSQRLGSTNITSESILISVLYLIGLIAWPKSDRKRGRGRPYVYLPTSCNTEMFCSQDMVEIGF
jgi:hypothetical protein